MHPRTIPNLPDGTFNLDIIDDYIRPTDDPHQPMTQLVCVENTQNFCGGKIIPLEFLKKVSTEHCHEILIFIAIAMLVTKLDYTNFILVTLSRLKSFFVLTETFRTRYKV